MGLTVTAHRPASSTPPTAQAREVIGAEHWVEHGGIRLYVWEKYAGAPSGQNVVVLAPP